MARRSKPSGLPDKGKPVQTRPVNSRQKPPHFLIVCGGEKTEPNYFEAFRVDVKVEVVGTKNNPETLVRFTKEKQAQAQKEGRAYQNVWVVFDRDDFPAEDFNNAIEQARQAGFSVAYSNEAFELWYILHFDYINSGVSRKQYKQMLSERLKTSYKKNDPMMYSRLVNLQPIAIRNAETLLKSYQPTFNPTKDNPCTTVHQLVIQLNEHLV